jgi:opacity protein-like surface antigen
VEKSKVFLMALMLMLASLTAFAQTTAPAGEFYGGYQYMRLDTGAVQDAINLAALEAGVPPFNFGRHQNLNGWSFGAQENLNSWFGGIIDVGGAYYTNKNISVTSGSETAKLRVRLHSYTFMAGPQFTMRRNSTFQPFARGLIGGGFVNSSANILLNNVPLIAEVKNDDANFAFGGGAGTDMNFSPRLGMRVAVDYIRTQLFNDNQNNLRGTVSLVFRWGSTPARRR